MITMKTYGIAKLSMRLPQSCAEEDFEYNLKVTIKWDCTAAPVSPSNLQVEYFFVCQSRYPEVCYCVSTAAITHRQKEKLSSNHLELSILLYCFSRRLPANHR